MFCSFCEKKIEDCKCSKDFGPIKLNSVEELRYTVAISYVTSIRALKFNH